MLENSNDSRDNFQKPLDNLVAPTTMSFSELDDASLELDSDDIHVWFAKLDDRPVGSLGVYLSPDEAARAHRFRFEKDRNHFTLARGLLRRILACYLDSEPSEFRFSYGEQGKPALSSRSDQQTIKFNLAHSHGMAVYAFSRNRELGVDLEFMRDERADEAIAERFFSAREVVDLKSLPCELRKQAFFNCWTRKEAYIKARGEGLSMALNEFDVSLKPGEPAALLKNHRNDGEVSRWSMQSLPIAKGYAAALVVEGYDWKLNTFSVSCD